MPISPENLKKLRKKLSLSQMEAADSVLVPKRTWQNWETAENKSNHRAIPEAVIELFCIKNKVIYKIDCKKVLIEL